MRQRTAGDHAASADASSFPIFAFASSRHHLRIGIGTGTGTDTGPDPLPTHPKSRVRPSQSRSQRCESVTRTMFRSSVRHLLFAFVHRRTMLFSVPGAEARGSLPNFHEPARAAIGLDGSGRSVRGKRAPGFRREAQAGASFRTLMRANDTSTMSREI